MNARANYPDGLRVVVQRTVLEARLPALIVIHDDEDDWLVGDGVNDPNQAGSCVIAHMEHLIEVDPTLMELADLPLGCQARRSSPSRPWERSRHEY